MKIPKVLDISKIKSNPLLESEGKFEKTVLERLGKNNLSKCFHLL